jgi:hypothetical protein
VARETLMSPASLADAATRSATGVGAWAEARSDRDWPLPGASGWRTKWYSAAPIGVLDAFTSPGCIASTRSARPSSRCPARWASTSFALNASSPMPLKAGSVFSRWALTCEIMVFSAPNPPVGLACAAFTTRSAKSLSGRSRAGVGAAPAWAFALAASSVAFA